MKKNITAGVKKNAIDKKTLMIIAWNEARMWAKKLGGKAVLYISYCMRWAWALMKKIQKNEQIQSGLDQIEGTNKEVNRTIVTMGENPKVYINESQKVEQVTIHEYLRCCLTLPENKEWRENNGVKDIREGKRLYDLYERIFLLYRIDWTKIPDGLVSAPVL